VTSESTPRATTVTATEPLKFLTPHDVRMVAAEFGTPVFVYDEVGIERAAHYLRTLPTAFGTTIRYSLKANPTAAVIRLFDRLGMDFDASSIWEVHRAVRAGIAPSRILLTGQEAVFDDVLVELVDAGLQFDAGSLVQLRAFGAAYPGAGVSVRVNPGFGSGLVSRLTSGGPNSSFGIWHEYVPEVKRIVDEYRIRLFRLHSHIGSGHHRDVLIPAARKLLDLARQFPDVEVINLGGGYRLQTLLSDPEYNHAEWAEVVADDMREFAVDTGRRLRLELEPGTFLVSNAGSLVTSVLDVVDTGERGHTFVKINGGLTELIRPSYYGASHPLVSVTATGEPSSETSPYCVAGHCCIAGDMLTIRSGDQEDPQPVMLAHTEPGDYLVVERSGGYAASMSLKNFNSYPESPEVLRRKDGSFQLIRARQTVEQIIANERIPEDLLLKNAVGVADE
jgi:diaminopimelate decarboxylase